MATILRLAAWVSAVRCYLADPFFMDRFVLMAKCQNSEEMIPDLPVKGNTGFMIAPLIEGDNPILGMDILGILGFDPVKRLLFSVRFRPYGSHLSAAL